MRSSKVITKYVLFHAAELVLVVVALIVIKRFVNIPLWLIIAIPLLLAIKDVVLFPKVWRAYDSSDNRPTSDLIGSEATVVDTLDPTGYVRVRGELWKAEIRDPSHPAGKGETVRVVDVEGMTLIVERRQHQAVED